MQELRAQLQAQLKLADQLRKMGEAGELDPEAQAELDAIQGKLAKYKGKYGKDMELDWVCKEMLFISLICTILKILQMNQKRVRTVTIIFYETSL